MGKGGFQFSVVDYAKPQEETSKFKMGGGGSQIQIGVMDQANYNKDAERNREIDMAELNALLGN